MNEELTKYAQGLAKELGLSLFYDDWMNTPCFEKRQGKLVTQAAIRQPFEKRTINDAALKVCMELERFRVNRIIKAES